MSITTRQETTLNNMWRERADAIRKLVKQGSSFTSAEKATFDHYDTVSWSEVPSRLWRARGNLLKLATSLCYDPSTWEMAAQPETWRQGLELIKAIESDCGKLIFNLSHFPIEATEQGKLPSPNPASTTPELPVPRALRKNFWAFCGKLIASYPRTPTTSR